MENIEVSESQRPNYATYDLIGRSGSLYAYLGSKSREMNLKFNITLPNIVDYIHNVGLSQMFSNNFRKMANGISKIEERKKFLKKGSEEDTNITENLFKYYEHGKWDMQQLDSTFVDGKDSKSGVRDAFSRLASFFNVQNTGSIFNDIFGKPNLKKGFSDIDMGQAVNLLMMWINVIRTSVINNSTQTQYGPPTIYIKHGTMYKNIPCVFTNFSIIIANNAGYELLSLAPRQVEVTMNLSENRSGNFGEFKPFDLVNGDNLTGWESVIDGKGTMDPHNQFLRLYRDTTVQKEFDLLFDF
jgi:hypothetical protein